MSIDFTIPEDAKKVREKVRQWVQDECIPAEKRLTDGEDYKTVLNELRTKARKQGLWLPFIPEEHGGMGLGPLANALVQMELGQSHLGALSMNSQGPDDATMLTLLAHGTDYQKEKFLKPILNGEKRVCYSMTEKAAGADATGMQTRAEKDGNSHYVLNGEKWYSSAASIADIAVVMAKTNPEAPRHEQYSTFIVELPDPGYNIVRDIPTMAVHGPLYEIMGGGHAEVKIENLRVPQENLLGGEGKGFAFGRLWTLFGTTNQLTAGLALSIIGVWVLARNRNPLAALIPLVFLLFMTTWALILNLFDFFAKGDWLLLVMDAAIFVLAAWLAVEAFTAFNRERMANKNNATAEQR